MRRVVTVLGLCATVMLSALPVLADEAKASDYSGISYLYYSVIVGILGWGVYDIFFRKS